jgi:hypothetical protein
MEGKSDRVFIELLKICRVRRGRQEIVIEVLDFEK